MSHMLRVIPHTTEQLKGLQKYMDDEKIPYTILPAIPTILPSMNSNPILHIDRPMTHFKATPEFKTFLGAEYLTKHGTVLFEDILERIYIYVRSHKLLSNDSLGFYLDDMLHSLLKTQSTHIDWNVLHQHIQLLLPTIKN